MVHATVGLPGAAAFLSNALRLLHVVPTYLPAVRYGGPIRSVHALCRALAAAGHEVEVFTTNVDGPGDSDVPLFRPVDIDGVKVTYFPSRWLRRLYWSPSMGRALLDSVAGFDVVHLHAVFLWPILAAGRAARTHGVPYVLSPRGMLVPELIQRKSRLVKQAWISLIERRNLEKAAAILTTSAVEAGHLSQFGWALPPVVTIPHGVDDPPATAGAVPSPDIARAIEQRPMVLALGRLSWEKGLDRLIEALTFAPSVRAVIAGESAGRYADTLAEQVRRLGLAGRVTIVARHVDGADKEALFAAARVFAMTSLSENFGIASLEAMRRSVPVLATPGVGMSEVVRESGGGRVVEAAPAAIGKALEEMVADEGARVAMGRAGRDHVIAHYGWASIADRVAGLYRSVAGQRPRGAARP